MQNIFVCIDLKSFYASVECRERNLDPLNVNLLVADESRTDKTVCLAVTPSLKAYGIKGRARLFEVKQKVKEVNFQRKMKLPNKTFTGKSFFDDELKKNNSLELDYIIAPPRMKYYMKYSNDIYKIYLKYLSSDDIYAYSIDEIFCDITHYLKTNHMKAREFVTMIIHDVYETTGITATAGIGTNMYLAKIAMDIVAKHVEPNEYGVRIACLDEKLYRQKLWNHKPITDFWRVGKGIAQKLEKNNIYTMGDIARCSVYNEDLLYKLFGINAELLIDHAWGYESCTIESVKNYVPSTNSICSGQVLHSPYNYEDTKIVLKEMSEALALDLVSKNLVTNQIVLTIGYDVENLQNSNLKVLYKGEVTEDKYGRKVPKNAHGTINIDHRTSSVRTIMNSTIELYNKIINKNLLIRRINLTANNVINENDTINQVDNKQLDLFDDYKAEEKQFENEMKERNLQRSIIHIKEKYGKNSILKGMNFEKAATMKDRNNQVGGHQG